MANPRRKVKAGSWAAVHFVLGSIGRAGCISNSLLHWLNWGKTVIFSSFPPRESFQMNSWGRRDEVRWYSKSRAQADPEEPGLPPSLPRQPPGFHQWLLRHLCWAPKASPGHCKKPLKSPLGERRSVWAENKLGLMSELEVVQRLPAQGSVCLSASGHSLCTGILCSWS